MNNKDEFSDFLRSLLTGESSEEETSVEEEVLQLDKVSVEDIMKNK